MPNEKKIFEDTGNIESVIIDSDSEQIDEVIKEEEEEKAPAPAKRGRGRPKNTQIGRASCRERV